MKKITFKNKFYIVIAVIYILALIVDIFNIIEVNRYNSLMFILLLFILLSGTQYYAAKKGLDTMLSINREYKIRKLWNRENKYDWERVRKSEMKWAPIYIGGSLILVVSLYFTDERYSWILLSIWAIITFLYIVFTRPLKVK